MEHVTQLKQLGHCLAGVFQNREQALAEPAWFVHLRLWSYPVTLFTEDSFTFFIEQASAAFAQLPYRQRILRVRLLNTNSTELLLSSDLTAEYYALKQPQAYQGATQSPERLKAITEDDLQPLSGSQLQVTSYQQQSVIRYEARQRPGERCQFIVNGEVKNVELAFDAFAPAIDSQEGATFLMYDKGIEPETGKVTWGAINGPFRLKKVEDFSSALPKIHLK